MRIIATYIIYAIIRIYTNYLLLSLYFVTIYSISAIIESIAMKMPICIKIVCTSISHLTTFSNVNTLVFQEVPSLIQTIDLSSTLLNQTLTVARMALLPRHLQLLSKMIRLWL